MSGVIHSPEFIANKQNCQHQWGSSHDPELPVYWIRQCLLCRKIDGVDLREQLVEAGWEYFEFSAEHYFKHTPLDAYLYQDCEGCRICYLVMEE